MRKSAQIGRFMVCWASFVPVVVLVGVCWVSFVPGVPWWTGELCRGGAAEGPHGARVVCPRSLWAPLVSEEKFRMQFPTRHFKS